MAEKFTLQFETRTLFGKKVNRLRREGILPATVYGKNIGPFAVQINGRTFSDLVRKSGKTALIDVIIPGQPVLAALVHTVQRHPVSREFIHADLLVVDLKTAITVDVPVHLVGESPIVKSGGAVLNHTLTTISIHALPGEIPSHVEVDVSVLDSLDKNILVSDIKLPGESTVVTAADEVVASVTPSTVEGAASSEAPAEPELVREDRGESAE